MLYSTVNELFISRLWCRPFHREICHYQSLQALCCAYYKLSVALRKDQKVALPDPELDNEQVRYDRRFTPLWCTVTPPSMPYRYRNKQSPVSIIKRENYRMLRRNVDYLLCSTFNIFLEDGTGFNDVFLKKESLLSRPTWAFL